MTKLIENLEKQLSNKGAEINAYIEKHNIQIQGRKDTSSAASDPSTASKSATSGVLVSDSAK